MQVCNQKSETEHNMCQYYWRDKQIPDIRFGCLFSMLFQGLTISM